MPERDGKPAYKERLIAPYLFGPASADYSFRLPLMTKVRAERTAILRATKDGGRVRHKRPGVAWHDPALGITVTEHLEVARNRSNDVDRSGLGRPDWHRICHRIWLWLVHRNALHEVDCRLGDVHAIRPS